MRLRNFSAQEIQPNLIVRAPHDPALAAHVAVMRHIQNELIGDLRRVAADQFGAGMRNVGKVALVRRLAGAGIDPARLIYFSTIIFSSVDRHRHIPDLGAWLGVDCMERFANLGHRPFDGMKIRSLNRTTRAASTMRG